MKIMIYKKKQNWRKITSFFVIDIKQFKIYTACILMIVVCMSNNSYKWGINLFYLYLCSYWTRNLLSFIQINICMNNRYCNSFIINSYCIFRICITMKTNIILRSKCYYKLTFSYSLY